MSLKSRGVRSLPGFAPFNEKMQNSFINITASELTANIKAGWCLGDTLDATNHKTGWKKSIRYMETYWDKPVTTKALIDAVKKTGINAIRIPVTWTKASDPAAWNIRTDWMARVTEVVNYAVDNDMYIILNTHHDDIFFKYTDNETEQSLIMFKKIWEQIAGNFKNYSEKLMFEALNEPRTKGAAHEWNGGIPEEHINLNRHYQVFVDTVRGSGGNNDRRILIITPYCAGNNDTAVNGLELPKDSVLDKLIVSIHSYDPEYFCFPKEDWMNGMETSVWSKSNPADTSAIHDAIQPVYKKFAAKGIPVIVSEFGAVNKDNIQARADYVEYFIKYTRNLGIRCFWWDDGITSEFELIDRKTGKVIHPQVATALLERWG
jgi:endoglucanase